jgi:CRISPR/Cas system-associated exonuclease Cas4 (RecB family)
MICTLVLYYMICTLVLYYMICTLVLYYMICTLVLYYMICTLVPSSRNVSVADPFTFPLEFGKFLTITAVPVDQREVSTSVECSSRGV